MPKYLSYNLQWSFLEMNLKQRLKMQKTLAPGQTDACFLLRSGQHSGVSARTHCLHPGWRHVIPLVFMSHEGPESRSQMAGPSESCFHFQDLAPWGWLMGAQGSLHFTFPEVTMELAKPSLDKKNHMNHVIIAITGISEKKYPESQYANK